MQNPQPPLIREINTEYEWPIIACGLGRFDSVPSAYSSRHRKPRSGCTLVVRHWLFIPAGGGKGVEWRSYHSHPSRGRNKGGYQSGNSDYFLKYFFIILFILLILYQYTDYQYIKFP